MTTPTTAPHGYGRYTSGCRCSVCREAKRRYMKARRGLGLDVDSPLHGTYTGYDSYGCRCWPCQVAKARHRSGRS